MIAILMTVLKIILFIFVLLAVSFRITKLLTILEN